MIRTLGAAALAAASLLAAAPADAACVGEDRIFFVCATGPDVTVGEETFCVYAGTDSCTEVTVPVPRTSGGASVQCGGLLYNITVRIRCTWGPDFGSF